MTGLPDVIVTYHARERWIERVDGRATVDTAAATIAQHAGAVRAAAAFGCHCVKLPCGARLIVDGLNVVTVLGRGHFPGRFARSVTGAIA